jgi:hypothetical protein
VVVLKGPLNLLDLKLAIGRRISADGLHVLARFAARALIDVFDWRGDLGERVSHQKISYMEKGSILLNLLTACLCIQIKKP